MHDLAASKLVAGRERDVEFIRVLLRDRLVDLSLLQERLGELPLPADRIAALQERLRRIGER